MMMHACMLIYRTVLYLYHTRTAHDREKCEQILQKEEKESPGDFHLIFFSEIENILCGL